MASKAKLTQAKKKAEKQAKLIALLKTADLKTLTMLSFGGGQDSTALLAKFMHDKGFREEYAPNDLIVVMADTGDEHPETYQHISYIIQVCKEANIPFYFITKDQGFHTGKWTGLREFYKLTQTVGSKVFRKTCSDNLKIKPIYRFLEKHIHNTHKTKAYGKKKAFYEFREKYGKINVIIGIAAGEEQRIANPKVYSAWERDCLQKVYPLVELGMDRKACQEYIKAVKMRVPNPSNCMLCPYMNDIELLWLHRFYPDSFADWVEIEAAKLKRFAYLKDKNVGVWKGKDLTTKLAEVQKKHGAMTDAQLQEYKFSHGHCVMSKY